jgi:UDP-2,3-diacylglucosamine pyrophosphatase LpxH
VSTANVSTVRVRTVFVSDVHLGSRACHAAAFRAFLERVSADRLVLVGDIVDLWALRRAVYWPDEHQECLRTLLRLARSGTEVVYVPGNHDAPLRELCGLELAGVQVEREFVHVGADGRRFLVTHGDDFDGAVQFSGLLRRFGAFMYDAMIHLGRAVHAGRRRLGLPLWSLAAWVKQRVPDAREYVARFEHAAAHEASRRALDGVICGHIHRPGVREVDGILYCNDGDWVESCTALVEDRSGRMVLVDCTGAPVRAAQEVPRATGLAPPIPGRLLDPAA